MSEEVLELITSEALALWSKRGGSWVSARRAIAKALSTRYDERDIDKALRRIGRLVDIFGDDPTTIATFLEEARTKTEYECGAFTVIRAINFGASGYHFGGRTASKGRLLRGRPLLLGVRLCPLPLLSEAISGFVVVEDNMPGAFEVEIPCSDGIAVAHVFANGAVTLAAPNWQCAFEAYDRLSAAASRAIET